MEIVERFIPFLVTQVHHHVGLTDRHGIQRDRHGEKFIQPLNNHD